MSAEATAAYIIEAQREIARLRADLTSAYETYEKERKENERLRKVIEAGIKLQAKNYGDGIGTHLNLIGWAEDAQALLQGGECGGEAPQTMTIPHDASKAYGPL